MRPLTEPDHRWRAGSPDSDAERVNDFETSVCLVWAHLASFDLWRGDPNGGWLVGRFGWLFDEAFGMGFEGVVERDLAGGMDVVGLSIMNLIRRHQAQADVMMRLIVST
jgi:hypothetical protein